MKLRITALVFFVFLFCETYAQLTDEVSQLVAIENYLSVQIKRKGLQKAIRKVTDGNTLVLTGRGAVKPADFLNEALLTDSAVLTWEPTYARIAKSGDWGVTTGPFTCRKNENAEIRYGDYLSVWRKDRKGAWKLAMISAAFHEKPASDHKLEFVSPRNNKFVRQRSESRLQQRKDIILSSDKLYGTILKADNDIARKEFLSENSRLFFPGYEPFIGKRAITAFWKKQKGKLTSSPADADRAYSGELAMTYGEAVFQQGKTEKDYRYIRIWEIQPEFNWNVILELYLPTAENP